MENRNRDNDIEQLLLEHDLEFYKVIEVPEQSPVTITFKKSEIIHILLGNLSEISSLNSYIEDGTLDVISLKEFTTYVRKEVVPYLAKLLSIDSLEDFIATPAGGVYAHKLFNSPTLYPSSSLELFLCHLYRQSLIESEIQKAIVIAKSSMGAEANEVSKSLYELIDALATKSKRVKKRENDDYIANQTMLAKELGIGEEGVEIEGLEELLPHMKPINEMNYKREE